MDTEQYRLMILILICVALGFLVLVTLFSILSYRNSRKIKKDLSATSLKLTANITYDSDNLGESLCITVFNSNYRDIVLHDFGFQYKNQIVSFIEEYSERKLTKGKVVVPSRSSITYKVNPERIEKFVVSHNFNASNIDSIYITAVDSVGNKAIVKDKELTKVFSARQKARLQLAKRKLHEEKVEQFKEDHEGNAPMSDSFWRMFHHKEVKIPEIQAKANSFIADKTKTPDNVSGSTYNPAPKQKEESSSTSNSEKRMDTKDMKVTFLDLDLPLKSKEVNKKEK